MKIQFIVHCWLDAERIIGVSKKDFAIGIRSAAWVNKRIRIFKNYTLKSLLNQSFDDFRIFLFCGERFQDITRNFDFETDRVERIYDYGRRAYQEIDAEFASIMRIDSDDLFHRNMMIRVRDLVVKGHRMFSARKLIQWNILRNFVTDIKIPVSPFTNHLFPKSVYRDFDLYRKRQFMGYRSAPELLPQRHVCIIRHKQNVTWPRIGKDPASERYRREEMAKRNNIILDRSRIIRVLKDFGIPAGLVPKRGEL
jgi:hypothetical protein